MTKDVYPSEVELRYMQSLIARRRRAKERVRKTGEELAKAVQLVHDEKGVSVRMLAAALDTSSSTIQEWTRRGRELNGN
jgi:DNA-binding transcriptional regulator YiaG